LSQIRFIGYNEPLSQEVLQLISRASVPAGVVLGLEASVEDSKVFGVVNVKIKSGLLSMADGMLVAESDDILIPVAVNDSDAGIQYTLTLIAEKGTGIGKLDDPVTYKVLPGRFYASQMPQVVGRLRMPLAFITKAPTGVSAASFSAQNLGDRSVLNKAQILDAPISNLLPANGLACPVKMDLLSLGYLQSLRVSAGVPSKYYLPVFIDANHQILAVTFLGRSNTSPDVVQKIKVTSLATNTILAPSLQFFGTDLVPQTATYPSGNPVVRDVLEISVQNFNSNGTPSLDTQYVFELQQVVIVARRIFA
jgi:hypothetical protein